MNDKETITFLFGNGLGMAIDPEAFNLRKIANELSEEEKYSTMNKFIKGNVEAEDPLKLMQATAHGYHDILNIIENLGFSDANGNEFEQLNYHIKEMVKSKDFAVVKALNQFVNDLVKKIFNYNVPSCSKIVKSFNSFMNNLWDLIAQMNSTSTKIHFTTLNYDSLIYESFVANKIKLTDGFLPSGKGHCFKARNLIQGLLPHHDCIGLYLHLHGSPLFYSNKEGNEIYKHIKLELAYDEIEYDLRHIVLGSFKQRSIQESSLLTTYWDVFYTALKWSKTVILFGYSGRDMHVNEALHFWSEYVDEVLKIFSDSEISEKKRLVIVEWDGGDNSEHEFCYDKLRFLEDKVDIHSYKESCILDFDIKSCVNELLKQKEGSKMLSPSPTPAIELAPV